MARRAGTAQWAGLDFNPPETAARVTSTRQDGLLVQSQEEGDHTTNFPEKGEIGRCSEPVMDQNDPE